MDGISVTWNGLCWFVVQALAVVVLILGQLVASNLHFWTVSLNETATMAPKVNIN